MHSLLKLCLRRSAHHTISHTHRYIHLRCSAGVLLEASHSKGDVELFADLVVEGVSNGWTEMSDKDVNSSRIMLTDGEVSGHSRLHCEAASLHRHELVYRGAKAEMRGSSVQEGSGQFDGSLMRKRALLSHGSSIPRHYFWTLQDWLREYHHALQEPQAV